MRRRRAATIAACLVLLVATTAGSCDKGNVIKIEWHEDSLGNKQCDITVRPDDQDSAPFKLKDQRKSRCDRCPVGARWPDCNKERGNGLEARIYGPAWH